MSRVAVVTGGIGGLGTAMCKALIEQGRKAVAVDYNGLSAEAVDKWKAARAAEGLDIPVYLADVTSFESCAEVCKKIEAEVGPADILVNNAGIQRVASIHEYDPDTFRLIQSLMVTSPFLLIRAVLPGMYERGWGRIINISSVHGIRASAFKSAYVAAKHGLEGLSKVTALEGGPHGVTSNCVNPAYVRTPLVEKQIADQAEVHGISEAEVVEKIMLTEPAIKRMIEPAEVGSLAGWLVSDNAGMVTGSSYVMDGGWSAR